MLRCAQVALGCLSTAWFTGVDKAVALRDYRWASLAVGSQRLTDCDNLLQLRLSLATRGGADLAGPVWADAKIVGDPTVQKRRGCCTASFRSKREEAWVQYTTGLDTVAK